MQGRVLECFHNQQNFNKRIEGRFVYRSQAHQISTPTRHISLPVQFIFRLAVFPLQDQPAKQVSHRQADDQHKDRRQRFTDL